MGPPPGGPYGGPPPGDPYGSPYGPQTPQKKTSPWLWVSLGCGGLFIIGLVLVLVLVFVVGDSDSDSGTGSETSTSDEGAGSGDRSNPDMPGMNEQVEHDGIVFTVTGIETGVTDVEGHRPQGEYAVVDIQVQPADDVPVTFWLDEQHLYTNSGEAIAEDYLATLEYGGINGMNVQVGPGDSEEVSVIFDVSDTSEISHVGLSAETYGGNEVDIDVTG
ncbi:hypothetical protein [Nocardiopsis nanhaiensis]